MEFLKNQDLVKTKQSKQTQKVGEIQLNRFCSVQCTNKRLVEIEIKKRGQKEATGTKQTSEIKVRKLWNTQKKKALGDAIMEKERVKLAKCTGQVENTQGESNQSN